MENSLKQEIWNEIVRLHMKYAARDLAHHAHGIWLLARDVCDIIQKYNACPYVVGMANGIVNFYIQLYKMTEASETKKE